MFAVGVAQLQPQPAGPATSTGSEGEGVVTVVGTGTAYGEPDMVTVELGVSTFSEDVREAVSFVDERSRAIQLALEALGVAERHVRTVTYNVWREERFEGNMQEPRPGFRARHTLSVTVPDAPGAGEVLTAAIEAGANEVGGMTFGLADLDSLEAAARAKAVGDAIERARQLADAAGLELGPLLTMEEPAARGDFPVATFERSAALLDAAPIAPGQLSVEIRVVATFRLLDESGNAPRLPDESGNAP